MIIIIITTTTIIITLECRLVHGSHARAVMFARKSCNVNLKRHRSHGRPEVVETGLKPINDLFNVAVASCDTLSYCVIYIV